MLDEFLGEIGIQFLDQFEIGFLLDEVVQLVGVGVVVVQEPRTIQVADIGVAVGADAPVFSSSDFSSKLTKGGLAGEQGRSRWRINLDGLSVWRYSTSGTKSGGRKRNSERSSCLGWS